MVKGQIKIQQMAFMLVALVLFFILVGLFVLGISFNGLKKTAVSLENENALLLLTRIANSPEFACGESFGNRRTSCIDLDKIMVLASSREYENFWGVGAIKIRTVYPPEKEEVCSFSNYPNCNIIEVYGTDEGEFQSNFVSLCRKEVINEESFDKCVLGKIMISSGGVNE